MSEASGGKIEGAGMPPRECLTRTPGASVMLLAPLALLQVADVLTTAIGLPRGGIEGNPINAALYAHGGWLGLLAMKAAFLAVVAAGVVWQWRINAAPRYAVLRLLLLAGLALLCVLAALIVAGNMLALA